MEDQLSKLSTSLCREVASAMESMQQKILLSSAKHATDDFFTTLDRSFTYRRKRIGPSMLPCGTPEGTGFEEE